MPQLVTSPTPFASPMNRALAPYGERQPNPSSSGTTSSVRLSCLGPNGRSVHALVLRDSEVFVESYRLPLAGTTENEDTAGIGSAFPDVVRTRLPQRIRAALNLHPPMELLCVDVDASTLHSKTTGVQKLPKLCLYTRKDAFLLEMGFTPSEARDVEGLVLAVTEPFERELLGTSTSINIIRIRQAPLQQSGYATMCPPECMAMLTLDSSINEYSLSSYHGKDTTTTPVSYRTEELEDRTERLADFCFCQSTTLSLLSSLSVALLKGSGEVLVASPIVFRGTVVSRGTVAKTLEYLDSELKESPQHSPRWRQYQAAKHFIMDVFPDSGNAQFLTAQAFSAAFEWPVQVQGPLMLAAESDDFETTALAIDRFSAGELVGLAVGHSGEVVEFGVLAPSTLVPRFQHETQQDTYQLDKDTKRGASVCRVDLRDEEADHGSLQAAVGLICDPIMDTVVHYVTPASIKSVSTNTLKLTANKARQKAGVAQALFSPPSKRRDIQPRTTAWSCFDVASGEGLGASVSGAVVSGDVYLGHTMVSFLSTGSLVAINLTEARQLQEMEAMGDGQTTRPHHSSASDRALKELQETPALFDTVEPLIKDVVKGLAGMGKIVGSATPTQAITPEVLAAAISVRQRCDKEILLPILEIKEHVKVRRKELEIMYANQLAQLGSVREKLKRLRERKFQIEEKAAIAKENALSLAQRSTSALQCTKDLQPTLSQAEYDYFQYLQGLDAKIRTMAQNFERLENRLLTIVDGKSSGKAELPSDSVDHLKKILEGTKKILQSQKQRLKGVESKVDDLNIAAGVDRIALVPIGSQQ